MILDILILLVLFFLLYQGKTTIAFIISGFVLLSKNDVFATILLIMIYMNMNKMSIG